MTDAKMHTPSVRPTSLTSIHVYMVDVIVSGGFCSDQICKFLFRFWEMENKLINF